MGSPVKGTNSLAEAAAAQWPGIPQEETSALLNDVSGALQRGEFHFILVSQDFRDGMGDTIAYLNSAMTRARFYGVELVKFRGNNVSAFETRSVWLPAVTGVSVSQARVDEESFLSAVQDDDYRESLRELLEFCRGLDLRSEWGSAGTSTRIKTNDRAEPVSIGWLFPAEGSYWYGLSGLSLGYDRYTVNPQRTPNALAALEGYLKTVATRPGMVAYETKTLIAYQIPASEFPEALAPIKEAVGELVETINGQ